MIFIQYCIFCLYFMFVFDVEEIVFVGKIVNKDDVQRIYDSVWYIESDDILVYFDEEVKLYNFYCQFVVLEQ